ncbi:MAG: hypothetical protein NWF13_02035 [Candidatus Bathyarchaeota archaeon]|nr:hypothetical protein [Candidatus Bathyarchaeota archaeon]
MMAKWFVNWAVNWSVMGQDQGERIKQQIMMLSMVKSDLAAGVMKDFGIRSGESSGYGITGDMSAEELNAWLIKWSPYVTFEANPVIDADQQIAALQNLVEMLKKLAG